MTVHDRVAFACRFLPDDKLNNCLSHITQTLKSEANLQAILLTGTAGLWTQCSRQGSQRVGVSHGFTAGRTCGDDAQSWLLREQGVGRRGGTAKTSFDNTGSVTSCC